MSTLGQSPASSPERRSPRLAMSGITKRFGATVALDAVDLEVYPGEVLALVGENGAGKSTLMKILSGAVQPDEGNTRLDGATFTPAGPLAARASGIAMSEKRVFSAPSIVLEPSTQWIVNLSSTNFTRGSNTSPRAANVWSILPPDHPITIIFLAPSSPIMEISSSSCI